MEQIKSGKFQLNSGVIPEPVYNFYRNLAAKRETTISVGVAEGLDIAMATLAEKYKMGICPQCRQPIENHHLFCWHCGCKVKSS